MKIVIFSGTTEGRELSRFLAERGGSVTVSVATEYGREAQGVCPGVEVVCGRRDRAGMAALLSGAALCVDATHPYAEEARSSIRGACADTGVPYRRLLRDAGGSDCTGKTLSVPDSFDSAEKSVGAEKAVHTDSTEARSVHADSAEVHSVHADSAAGRIVYVDSAAAAADYLSDRPGNVLLANGSRELARFAGLDRNRLFPRILPAHESLSACERLGIPHRNMIAIQGPFSRDLNEALIRQYGIAYVVTKDGGKAGGFPEKVEAARNTGAVLVVIRRPAESGGYSFAEIAAECDRLLGQRDRTG